MGVHQKIDRVARRRFRSHIPASVAFPRVKDILHFEGLNGPDGLKRKSPGRDEPWHFIEPGGDSSQLLGYIHDHITNLAEALNTNNHERSAFEAAWLAHAIVDGLTPAHHHPLEEQLKEYHGADVMAARNTFKKKLMLPGDTRRKIIKNNWRYWGAKGIMSSHIHFELGIMTAISTMRFDHVNFDERLRTSLEHSSFDELYLQAVNTIAALEMYEEFIKKGWTRKLARDTKNVLVPEIIHMVMLGWMAAVRQAEERKL